MFVRATVVQQSNHNTKHHPPGAGCKKAKSKSSVQSRGNTRTTFAAWRLFHCYQGWNHSVKSLPTKGVMIHHAGLKGKLVASGKLE